MSEFLAGHHYKEFEQTPSKSSDRTPPDPKAWFEEFIREVRARCAALPEASRGGIVHLDDFGPPCQVLVFWVREPERQFIFVAKESSLPDLMIEIHGPLEIGKALGEIGRILQGPWLQKAVRVEGQVTSYHDVLERDLIGLVRMLQFEIFHPEIAGAGTVIKRGPDHCKWFTWNVVGNLNLGRPESVCPQRFAPLERAEGPSGGTCAPLDRTFKTRGSRTDEGVLHLPAAARLVWHEAPA